MFPLRLQLILPYYTYHMHWILHAVCKEWKSTIKHMAPLITHVILPMDSFLMLSWIPFWRPTLLP
jgi:hypothetical protein